MEEVFPTYHVFINHSVPDVKKTLASLIYRALKRFGLRVFLDQQELQTGDSLTPAIMTAINSCSVHIAIFSPTYAESAWCLNELLWMLDCHNGAKLIPIFYGIHPLDLRYIHKDLHKGAYAKAFQDHRSKGRVDFPVVERWIHALNKVSHLSGLVFSNCNDDLGELLDRIVDDVLKAVMIEPLDVAMHPVGLDQAAEHFQHEILNQTERSESIMVVGIVGLGGSGKSTLVKHFYNSKRCEFRRCCFLFDISKKDLPSLQLQLVNDILGYQRHLQIENTSKGRSLLQDRLRGIPRVLIVFDDIDDTEQIENLLLVKDVLRNGSLILVTSHDRALLSRSQISILYDVKLLDIKNLQELFCQHAFHQPKPPQKFQELVAELVNICGGFPLALKVLAGQLSGNRDRSYWTGQLQNFQTQMPDDILQKVLKVSYESVKNKEKEAFLDIAHFLIGEDKDLAVRVLDGLIDYSSSCLDLLDTLHQKCLVEFETADVDFNVKIQSKNYVGKFEALDIELWRRPNGNFKIRMHDLVRELARQIGREQCPLRLCCSNDKIISPQLQSKPYTVRGIRRDEDEEKLQLPVFLRNQDICGLKILVLQHAIRDLQFNSLSGDYVWLRIPKFNCEDILSGRLSLRDLRVLELSDLNLGDLPPLFIDCEPPSQLRELMVTCTENYPTANYRQSTLNTSGSGFDKSSTKSSLQPAQMGASSSDTSFPPIRFRWNERFPVNFFLDWLRKLNLRFLVKIVLKNIKGMSSLPIKFEELKNLRHVDLSGCRELEELPHSFTQLLQLQYLALRDCRKLLFPDLGKISTLEYLDFRGCCLLEQLPRGTITQRSLKYLN